MHQKFFKLCFELNEALILSAFGITWRQWGATGVCFFPVVVY